MTNWEDHYRTGETPWDKGEPHPALIDYLAEHRFDGRVLAPGCGYGHDVRAIGTAADEVVGIDIAPSAVEGARKLPQTANVRFELADLFNLPEQMHGAFDWVWEHTCFCAIQPAQREAYVDAVATALKPRGHLLAVFYLDPGNSSPDEGPPFEVSVAELNRLFLPKFALEKEWVPVRTYPGREERELVRLLRKKE